MKFSQIPGGRFRLRISSASTESLASLLDPKADSRAVVAIDPAPLPGEFQLLLSDRLMPVRAIDIGAAMDFNAELTLGRALLAQLANPAPDGSVDLEVAFFVGPELEMGDVEIGVDEYVARRVSEVERHRVRDLASWMESQFAYRADDRAYYFLSAGPIIDDTLTEIALTDVTEGTAPRVESTVKNSFLLHGSSVRAVATATPIPDGRVIHIASRLTKVSAVPEQHVRLGRGQLAFGDWTDAGQIQILVQAKLATLTQAESSYLRKWDEFGDVEGELLLKGARAFGAVRYAEPVENRDGTTTVRIVDATGDALAALRGSSIESVEIVDEEPPYLVNPSLTFAAFSRSLAEAADLDDSGPRSRDSFRGTHLKIVRFDNETRSVTLDGVRVAPSGTLVLSLQGEVAQIRRRHSARKAIVQGRSANPQLGLIIEENGEITSLRSPQKVASLTAFVRGKVFRNAPTVMQVKAIEVALNTPDIAMIQGPPGTGKTTVIAAILERLNEEAAAAGKSLSGRVLLTGFQHDAVENLIDRLSLNAIPVPKFGTRSGTSHEANSFERHLELWSGDIAQRLREKNPQLADVEHEAEIRDQYVQYLQSPSRRLALCLVQGIAKLESAILGENLSRQTARLLHQLESEEVAAAPGSKRLDSARRIRVRPESFADDGPTRAEDALIDLETVLEPSEASVLDKASMWDQARGVPPFLDELAEAKRCLLLRLTEPPVFRVEKQSDEVVGLTARALARIRQRGHSTTDRKAAVLAEFLAELENNPPGIVDSVAQFSYAFAATVQQSVNKNMQIRKGVSGGTAQQLEYDYVIIDEAARVSPRDLMIPMSQGKRVVLVGDHRQLPHIIDEEVARSMDAGEASADELDWLKKSMFEYLFAERLKALEAADGIQRRVTLDKQFRMHPELGQLISRTFYERFDPRERFGSGLPASHFTHSLPGTGGKPAVWLDVPVESGTARRNGTSWTRQAESDRIVGQLRNWIESPEGADLTFGVISFYKAQADLIRGQLRQQLGAVVDDEHRIRVGTVDSFQGMEFDVVFLSIVRTVPQEWTQRGSEEAAARGLFGHLGLYNRLNVSMSRQKRLLVAVGDVGLVQHPLADTYIPGLADLYRLSVGAAFTSSPPAQTEIAFPLPPGQVVQQSDERKPGFFSRIFGRGLE
ncbi:DEAD/DEAH box helicase [Microcella sp.]|uniref:DEAD/DEAH box helicase n=1 Tax=Microcella sp. TaxID=1913979 RepID=UPI00391B785C